MLENTHYSGIRSSTDYYPFGSPLPNRGYDGGRYRFGFNGKENDNEVYGPNGTFQDYGMRMYDTRVGRFISVDPLTKKYPMLTPYQFASNSPIMGIDLDGKEILIAIDGSTTRSPGHTILIVPDYKKYIAENGEVSYQIQGLNVYATPYTAYRTDEDVDLNANNGICTSYIPQAEIKDFFVESLKDYDGIVQLTNKEINLFDLYNNYLVGGKKSLSENQISKSLKLNSDAIYSFANSPDMAKRKFDTSQETNGKGDFNNTINCAGFVSKVLAKYLKYGENLGVFQMPNSDGSGDMHDIFTPNQLFYDLLKSGGIPRRENAKQLEDYRK